MTASESRSGATVSKKIPPPGNLPLIGLFVARHRRNLLVSKTAGLCRRYLNWYGNLSYDLQTNGESYVLGILSKFRPKLLIDIGANVGGWTIEAKARCPGVQVHAFEIAPPTFAVLRTKTRDIPGVQCVNLGLSDVAGPLRIRHYNDLPALTTASAYPHPFPYVEMTVDVTTGDSYAAASGIQHVDMLKIDVEGMEEKVLKGFDSMLKRRAIDLVQFEYGRVSIINRFLLRDFYEFFRERGYVVGKIFPSYVDFKVYDIGDEDFMGPNYLACRADNGEYRRALEGR
jgi:FkbM family methyltransferase